MARHIEQKNEYDEIVQEQVQERVPVKKRGHKGKGFKQFFIFATEILTWSKSDHVSAYAAQAAFFLTLSAFPFVIMILTFVQYLPFEQADFILVLRGLLPDEIEAWFMRMLLEMINNTNNAILSISVLIALWSAARGILSISNGLNSVYRTQESRNYLTLRLIAMMQTLVVAVALMILLVVFVFGNAINDIIVRNFDFVSEVEQVAGFIISVRLVVGFVLFFLIFIVLYKWLPNHKITVRQAAPGAAFVALSWVLVSGLFSIYFTHFSNFARVYGSLTGMAIAMVWIYTMMMLVLMGGEINVYIMVHYEDFVNMIRLKIGSSRAQKSVES